MENVTAAAMDMHQSIPLSLLKSSSSLYSDTAGHNVLQYLYQVMNSAEQNPYYHQAKALDATDQTAYELWNSVCTLLQSITWLVFTIVSESISAAVT